MHVGKVPNGLGLLRWVLSCVAALALLASGTVGSHLLWLATHHRYDDPETGLYHGLVS